MSVVCCGCVSMSVHECVLVCVTVHMLYVYSVCECTSVHCGCMCVLHVCVYVSIL